MAGLKERPAGELVPGDVVDIAGRHFLLLGKRLTAAGRFELYGCVISDDVALLAQQVRLPAPLRDALGLTKLHYHVDTSTCDVALDMDPSEKLPYRGDVRLLDRDFMERVLRQAQAQRHHEELLTSVLGNELQQIRREVLYQYREAAERRLTGGKDTSDLLQDAKTLLDAGNPAGALRSLLAHHAVCIEGHLRNITLGKVPRQSTEQERTAEQQGIDDLMKSIIVGLKQHAHNTDDAARRNMDKALEHLHDLATLFTLFTESPLQHMSEISGWSTRANSVYNRLIEAITYHNAPTLGPRGGRKI